MRFCKIWYHFVAAGPNIPAWVSWRIRSGAVWTYTLRRVPCDLFVSHRGCGILSSPQLAGPEYRRRRKVPTSVSLTWDVLKGFPYSSGDSLCQQWPFGQLSLIPRSTNFSIPVRGFQDHCTHTTATCCPLFLFAERYIRSNSGLHATFQP